MYCCVRESLLRHTARFVCTTDADGNQIGSFYAGAMSEDADIKIAPLAEEHGGIDLVLIGAGTPGPWWRTPMSAARRA